ncbi:MAG: hypothetical protein V4608_14590 [Bacteroidota bacterium]
MDRRKFLKQSILATAGIYTAPYILPSGRMFASTGIRRADHVVFCLFAGGVRNLESVHKADGNLMRQMLNGSESISGDIAAGIDPLNPISGPSLQTQGTLFKEFRYNQGPTGHFNGHTTAITGMYTTTDLNIKAPPENPTIFEYYRKHTSPGTSALNSWWVSNALGPYPSLNFSSDSNYGALYGANYVQPFSLISEAGYNVLGNPKNFSTSQTTNSSKIKDVLNNNFGSQYKPGDAGIENTSTDAAALRTFINSSYATAISGGFNDPWGVGTGIMNSDMRNIHFAESIITNFKPELLVVNMQDVDICHADFTAYCNNLRKADYALAHLWQTIQNTPGMANNTVLIAAPEHGRNETSNTLVDSFGRYALDHTGEIVNGRALSREIFCLMLGPYGVVKQNTLYSTQQGESIDIVPTIADILGFYNDIPLSYRNRMGSVLTQAFV